MSERQILKVQDLASYLNVAKITIYRLTEKGEIPGHKVGGQWRFLKQEIDRWLRAKGRKH